MTLVPLALLAFFPLAQSPDATLPPAGAHLRLTAIGHGVQIYHCAAQAGTFQWTFDAPEAVLFDPATHQEVGTHSAGPTWTWNDGSAITGKVLQKQPASDAAAIPSLLLETKPSGDKTGALTGIAFVRRSDTQAGAAPKTGCDAQHVDNVLRVPYEATYTFYSTN
jgi:hypothetical protein